MSTLGGAEALGGSGGVAVTVTVGAVPVMVTVGAGPVVGGAGAGAQPKLPKSKPVTISTLTITHILLFFIFTPFVAF